MSSAYRLTGRIETGELAELYAAVQEPEGSQVVIKLFHPKTSDPRYAAVLARTYSVLNPLRSEGIVHVVHMGFVKNRLALVREAVEGYSLGAALQRLNSKEVLLPPPAALSLVIQLLETVERAHAAGVVHGALTPGNVLLSRTGQPRVADFGALQALLEVPELKRAFASRGRSAYRAPEVGRGSVPDVLSDVYSLGAILYELLTLREPLVPEGGVSTRRGGLPPPSRLDRRLHARLDPILLRALEATPTRRYDSCAEFASALRGFASAHGGLPGADELRRFVTELYPNEMSASTPGPVPFAESFPLTSISGVNPALVSAEALEKSVVARPSFSPSPSEADTMEAPPAFEEYQPEPTPTPNISPPLDPAVLSSTQIITPGAQKEEENTDLTGPAREKIEVTLFEPKPESSRVDHRTLPPLEDDEPTWVAPPGAAPKPRKATVMVGGAAAEHSRVGRNPRLRVVEDYSAPPAPEPTAPAAQPAVDPKDLADTDKIEVTTVRGRVVAEGTLSRTKVTEGTVTRARIPPDDGEVSRSKVTEGTVTRARVPPSDGGVSRSKVTEGTVSRARVPPSLVRSQADASQTTPAPAERTDIPMPPPSHPELPAAAGTSRRRLFTEERNLLADAKRRRRMLGLAGVVAALASVCFALALWRFSQWPHFDIDPKVAAASGEVDHVLAQQATPPPRPRPAPPAALEPAPSHTREEGIRTRTAWISISANVPTRILVDGVPLKHNLPLAWQPLRPGVHKITLETLDASHQREAFTVRLDAGDHRQMEQLFSSTASPHR